MKVWIRQIAQLVAFTGVCVTLVAGTLLGLRVPTLVLRGLIVGSVLYVAVTLLGRLAGDAVLGVALEHYLRRRTPASGERGTETAAEAARPSTRGSRAA
jgi:hypothetical protein